MKSIEERAEELYPFNLYTFEDETNCLSQQAYVKGATDQAEITKQEMIDKAKKAFCHTTCKGYQDIGRCLCDGYCGKYNQFVKLLEERYEDK